MQWLTRSHPLRSAFSICRFYIGALPNKVEMGHEPTSAAKRQKGRLIIGLPKTILMYAAKLSAAMKYLD
jgi:hypothetical protein